MLNTIWSSSGGTLNARSLFFIVMMFASPLLRFIGPAHVLPPWLGHWSKRNIQAMGGNGQYKQEILLFGLADWVMGKWRAAVDQQRDQSATTRDRLFVTISLVRDSIRSIVYVRLAPCAHTPDSPNLRGFATSPNSVYWHWALSPPL